MPEFEPTVLVADHCSEFPSICGAWLDCPVLPAGGVEGLLARLDRADVVLVDERLVQFAGERVRTALRSDDAAVVLVTLGESDDATTDSWYDAILSKPATRRRLTSVVERRFASARYDRHAAAFTRLAAALGETDDDAIRECLRQRRAALDATLECFADDWQSAFEACLPTDEAEEAGALPTAAFPPTARPNAGRGI